MRRKLLLGGICAALVCGAIASALVSGAPEPALPDEKTAFTLGKALLIARFKLVRDYSFVIYDFGDRWMVHANFSPKPDPDGFRTIIVDGSGSVILSKQSGEILSLEMHC